MSPREGEPGREETVSLTAALTPGRVMEPHSAESTVPREAHLSSRPQTSEHWHLDKGTEFSRTEARPGLHPGVHVLVYREHCQV